MSIINWGLQLHCNPRVFRGANKLVSKGRMKLNHRFLEKLYGIWYSFCILVKGFARPFEVEQLSLPRSCFSEGKNHLFLISKDEEWLILKKSFLKSYHHSKCFSWYYRSCFSTSSNIREASKLKNFFIEELKIP